MVKLKFIQFLSQATICALGLGMLENNILGGVKMTRNQIEYLKVRNDRNKADLDRLVELEKLKETNRANLVREMETERSNRAGESAKALANAINANVAQEQMRSNLAREAETNRSNLVNESISSYNAGTNRVNAEANTFRANVEAINAATRQQEADTHEYSANLQAGLNASKISSDNQNRKLQQQQIKESEAREKYYNQQSGIGVTSRGVKDIFDTLKTAGELVLLFQ